MKKHKIRRVSAEVREEISPALLRSLAVPPLEWLNDPESRKARAEKRAAEEKLQKEIDERWANTTPEEYERLAEMVRKQNEERERNRPLSDKLARLWEDR